ncbi:hypothetical protein BU26DRAFT_218259 [Trematosphaeria pertusa]|uniref:Uncharacterized protein n=1 Tax=Trematosphaeria pertusa TaxID=390896 RepID=A0A6A6IT08_9PLEO|nr:uncharacterized protein BU26DRAFT_218259 [Trematosphaeria pertusa]KAF2253227.1 hypothetical protein BU26DRAFT_218259 [Trematosphaeria pertusa]
MRSCGPPRRLLWWRSRPWRLRSRRSTSLARFACGNKGSPASPLPIAVRGSSSGPPRPHSSDPLSCLGAPPQTQFPPGDMQQRVPSATRSLATAACAASTERMLRQSREYATQRRGNTPASRCFCFQLPGSPAREGEMFGRFAAVPERR